MEDLKNTLSTYAGIAGAVGAIIIGLPTQGIVLPNWLMGIGATLVGLSATVLGVLQGRNADGSKKTPEQIAAQK